MGDRIANSPHPPMSAQHLSNFLCFFTLNKFFLLETLYNYIKWDGYLMFRQFLLLMKMEMTYIHFGCAHGYHTAALWLRLSECLLNTVIAQLLGLESIINRHNILQPFIQPANLFLSGMQLQLIWPMTYSELFCYHYWLIYNSNHICCHWQLWFTRSQQKIKEFTSNFYQLNSSSMLIKSEI